MRSGDRWNQREFTTVLERREFSRRVAIGMRRNSPEKTDLLNESERRTRRMTWICVSEEPRNLQRNKFENRNSVMT